MKAREFWINANNIRSIDTQAFNCDDIIHVREVMPIDWSKLWREFTDGHGLPNFNYKRLQQLVEKQLAGEE